MKSIIKKCREKNGSYTIEAAVVLPISILVTITLVLIIMFFYSTSVSQSHMHMILRYEAGNYTGHCHNEYFDADRGNLQIEIGRINGEKCVSGTENVKMINEGVLLARGERIIYGKWHCSDGIRYVRTLK